MEQSKLPDESNALSIAKSAFAIVLGESAGKLLSLMSPPIEDISEMVALSKASFSLREEVASKSPFDEPVRAALDELLLKEGRFSESPVFHNRVANLHRALGDLEREAESAERAFQLDSSPFFQRKVGESQISRSMSDDARETFLSIAHRDANSSLRLAALCIAHGDIDGAISWVDKAVELNPAGYAERLFQGGIQLVLGSADLAVGYLRMALEDRPNSSVAHCNLGIAYLRLSRPDKAFSSLKRAVALDPFNRSALLALSDVGVVTSQDADVLNSLRYYVEFEQKDAAVWARLARSLLRMNLIDDCIFALRNQGALKNSMAVWNNLGVAHAMKKSTALSLRAFKYALTLTSEDGLQQELLVARNIAQAFKDMGKPELVLDVTNHLIAQDEGFEMAKDVRLGDLYIFHIDALRKLGRAAEANKLSDKLVVTSPLSANLVSWLVHDYVLAFAVDRSDDAKFEAFLSSFVARISNEAKGVRLLNNIAYSYAEVGRLDEARKIINRISHEVHKDAYLTATLGLIHLRKGDVSRGEALYREAITLCKSDRDKNRIRQKLNLELGQAYMARGDRKGRKLLEKVAAEKNGEPRLTKFATRLLKRD